MAFAKSKPQSTLQVQIDHRKFRNGRALESYSKSTYLSSSPYFFKSVNQGGRIFGAHQRLPNENRICASGSRLLGFLDPWKRRYDEGAQTIQSLTSIVSGRVTGVGLGMGELVTIARPYAEAVFKLARDGGVGARLVGLSGIADGMGQAGFQVTECVGSEARLPGNDMDLARAALVLARDLEVEEGLLRRQPLAVRRERASK